MFVCMQASAYELAGEVSILAYFQSFSCNVLGGLHIQRTYCLRENMEQGSDI